jgi:subfamily B ATP-binding cassette protein MsbA
MESGRIVEEGKPTDLLAKGGVYARLHHRGEWAHSNPTDTQPSD